jgi:biopolymer transport protein ExbD
MLVATRIGSRAGRRTALWRQSEYYCRIDVSALLGVIIVLYIVLLAAQPISHGGVSADLPRSLHAGLLPGARRDDALRVIIVRDGRCFFGTSQLAPGELADRIRERVRDGAERKVYLAVDRRAKYGTVKLALVEVWRSGIKEVAILTN